MDELIQRQTPSGVWTQGKDKSWVLERPVSPERARGRKPEDYDPALVDWFGPIDQGDPWVQVAGDGSSGWAFDASVPTVAGVYRMTLDAAESATVEWRGTTPLPYGVDDMYRIRIRVKVPDGFTGNISAGIICYAYDGTTVVDETGLTSLALGHAAIRKVSGDSDSAVNGFAFFEGYLRGKSATAADELTPSDGTVAPFDQAVRVSNLAYYWRPYIQATAGAAPAVIDWDAFEAFRLDSSLVVPGTIQVEDLSAVSATVDTLQVTTALLLPGGTDGDVWTSDAAGNGGWEPQKAPLALTDAPPVNPLVGALWYDDAKPFVEPFYVVYSPEFNTITAPSVVDGTFRDMTTWETVQLDFPCSGLLLMDFFVTIQGAGSGSSSYYRPEVKQTVGLTATKETGVSDAAYARYLSFGSSSSDQKFGRAIWKITGVDEAGGTIEFKHQGRVPTGGAGGFAFPRWHCLFLPYMDERTVVMP